MFRVWTHSKCLWSPNLFVEFIAGPQGILDGVLVVRGMEVEEVHTIGLQPLKGCFQLGTYTLWLQRLPIPGVGLGSNAHCHPDTVKQNIYDMQELQETEPDIGE